MQPVTIRPQQHILPISKLPTDGLPRYIFDGSYQYTANGKRIASYIEFFEFYDPATKTYNYIAEGQDAGGVYQAIAKGTAPIDQNTNFLSFFMKYDGYTVGYGGTVTSISPNKLLLQGGWV